MALTIIADVHGKYDQYLAVARKYEYTIQLGDFGFRYDCLDEIDSNKHKLIFGNHDDYDQFYDVPHNLGDFGVTEHGGVTFFWMRGAFSIDWQQRVSYDATYGTKSWWVEEQLRWPEMEAAVELYRQEKPDIVITHTFPHTVAQKIGSRSFLANYGYDPDRFTTNTQQCLETMINIHQPKHWYGGHFHRNRDLEFMGTKFHCLAELGVRTI
jgi:hypothetical protein